MNSLEPTPPPTPKGSSLEGVVAAVNAVYARAERDRLAFIAAAADRGVPLSCPPGCGACCEPFIPDILQAEAAYAAAWILERAPDLAREIAAWKKGRDPAMPPCPFLLRLEDGARCAIYPARFLLCRLFGASGIRDKEGRAAFRPCARMPLAEAYPERADRRALTGEDLAEAFGTEPPFMADYATELAGLFPSESGERLSVFEALPSALLRLELILSLAARSPDLTYSKRDESEE
jgi:Fe-S-cluster containining protein